MLCFWLGVTCGLLCIWSQAEEREEPGWKLAPTDRQPSVAWREPALPHRGPPPTPPTHTGLYAQTTRGIIITLVTYTASRRHLVLDIRPALLLCYLLDVAWFTYYTGSVFTSPGCDWTFIQPSREDWPTPRLCIYIYMYVYIHIYV